VRRNRQHHLGDRHRVARRRGRGPRRLETP